MWRYRPVRESTGCISRNWDKFASAEVIVDQRAPKVCNSVKKSGTGTRAVSPGVEVIVDQRAPKVWQLGEEMGPDAGRVACVEVIKK